MSTLLIKNANIVFPDKISRNSAVLIVDGKIAKIYSSKNTPDKRVNEIIDANGNYLAPGFIDLHIHGLQNFLIDNGTEELNEICKILPQYGVTGFLPTVCPLPKGKDSEFLSTLSKAETTGAQILGFHLEGPFLTLTGALSEEALGKADIERIKNLITAAKPYRAIFSISPDFEDITKLIPVMAENGLPVFITHTAANVKQTMDAIKAGASHATHFYDVFYPPAETDPGVRPCGAVEAILADRNVSVDFILDGVHVDPIAVKMALQCKGNDGVCLITDANIGAGMGKGIYNFGSEKVEIDKYGSPARLVKNGGLAGSGLTMDTAVRNAVSMLNIDLPLAVKMASTNPARVLKVDNHKGKIAEGYDADFVLMNDKFKVLQTWINGNSSFKN
ncbi:MAG: N-acetylglucosamine-6-phosphate deacetylase [Planctomycetes bacterium GWF2_41_51]|nr:MAG: N-acetylglucosamine-6-phosphate deacetylase [Planctomycetes bacterium GWF2_41_51]HBG26934.1 N-acetylglucosamine-6-phosphate deacetylase [Phycisphaerales bacterium]